jgi:aminoglycoside phosphotransferase (APT) family kinase protein
VRFSVESGQPLAHDDRVDTTAPLATGGNRLPWHEVPVEVRQHLIAAVGATVVEAVTCSGGFSPGMASVLTLADGRRVFAKAVSVTRNEFAVDAIRREVKVLAALPEDIPAPRLRWSFDDGEWVALVTDAVEGRNPVQPWRADELSRFLEAMSILAERLTPSPISAESIVGTSSDSFSSWGKLAADPVSAASLDLWTQAHLDRLAVLEQSWARSAAGTSLLHGDLRSDNFLLTDDGFVVVDWPAVCVGAPWLDLLLALPSVAMHGGGDPQDLWLGHPLSRGVDSDAVSAVVAAVAGFFTERSLQPPIPNVPTLRAFQKAQGLVALRWLRRRTGW